MIPYVRQLEVSEVHLFIPSLPDAITASIPDCWIRIASATDEAVAIVFMPADLRREIYDCEGIPKMNDTIGGRDLIKASICESKFGLNIPSVGYGGGDSPNLAYRSLNRFANWLYSSFVHVASSPGIGTHRFMANGCAPHEAFRSETAIVSLGIFTEFCKISRRNICSAVVS
jgi:hypothetical protein